MRHSFYQNTSSPNTEKYSEMKPCVWTTPPIWRQLSEKVKQGVNAFMMSFSVSFTWDYFSLPSAEQSTAFSVHIYVPPQGHTHTPAGRTPDKEAKAYNTSAFLKNCWCFRSFSNLQRFDQTNQLLHLFAFTLRFGFTRNIFKQTVMKIWVRSLQLLVVNVLRWEWLVQNRKKLLICCRVPEPEFG